MELEYAYSLDCWHSILDERHICAQQRATGLRPAKHGNDDRHETGNIWFLVMIRQCFPRISLQIGLAQCNISHNPLTCMCSSLTYESVIIIVCSLCVIALPQCQHCMLICVCCWPIQIVVLVCSHGSRHHAPLCGGPAS